MLLDIYKDAIEYPTQNHKALFKLGVCLLFSFLIIPGFLVLGYDYRVLDISSKGMIGGREKLPEFTNLKEMLIDGLKMFVVSTVYALIPIAVFIIFMVIGVSIGNFNPLFGNGIVTGGEIITIIIFILFFFISYIASVNMVVQEGSIKAAFNIPEIWKIIGKIGWKRYTLFYLAYLIIDGFLLALVSIIFILLGMLFGIIGIATSPINFSVSIGVLSITGFSIEFIISFTLYQLFIRPYLMILRSRALGLIYEPLEEE